MVKWTKDELTLFANSKTLQNRPLNNDGQTFEENNPIWCVVANDRLFVRAAKGPKNSKWYVAGTHNGGQVEVDGQKFAVEYRAIINPEDVELVSAAMKKKYLGDPSLTPMTSALASQATVELIKK
ncbi:MAG: DUF2255 family protein [Lactobacillus johnsonii]|nr:DUF2255 family protein [Lactobacillus johnsonii]